MEFVIVAIIMFVLGGGTVGVGMARSRRAELKRELRDAIRRRVAVDDKLEVSLFDVFWDLGVNEYAIEIMGSQRLLPRDLDEVRVAHAELAESVRVHGSYSEFIRETLETIQEFYDEHRQAGNRRALPNLETRATKTLELPAVGADVPSTDNLPVPYEPGFEPVVAQSLTERMSARSGGAFAPLVTTVGGKEVDVDDLTRIDPMRILTGFFDGSLGAQFQKWMQTRTVRALKDELDGLFRSFYAFYVDQVSRNPDFYAQLYDTSNRWNMETGRIDALIARGRWKDSRWKICAEALFLEASDASRQLSWLARNNVDQTIGEIHDRARRGDQSMAGYLVYLNHYAFFAGRTPDYSQHIRGIESCTYRLHEELRKLQRKGVV